VTFDEYLGHRLAALLRYATVVTCDQHLAEDVVQEVLARAQPRWQKIAGLDLPEAYLKRMVLNEFLSWRRRRAALNVPLAREPEISDPADAISARDAMVRQIAALPPRQRAVLALGFYEGMNDDEIAVYLDCSPGTVRSHRSRALSTLRREAVHEHQ
jgi:RNA polymerase sigma-70 factor (sigma-E family)